MRLSLKFSAVFFLLSVCLRTQANPLDEHKVEVSANGKPLVRTIINRNPDSKLPYSEIKYFYGISDMCKKGPSQDIDPVVRATGDAEAYYADDVICRSEVNSYWANPLDSNQLIPKMREVIVYFPSISGIRHYLSIRRYASTGALEKHELTRYTPSGSVASIQIDNYFPNIDFTNPKSPHFQWDHIRKQEAVFYQGPFLVARETYEYDATQIKAAGQLITCAEQVRDWKKVERKPVLLFRKDEAFYDKYHPSTRISYFYKDGYTTRILTEGWSFQGNTLWSKLYRFIVTPG